MNPNEIDVDCTACSGTGESVITDTEGRDHFWWCPTCNGTGRMIVPDGEGIATREAVDHQRNSYLAQHEENGPLF